jgi:hypothetical protein
MPWVNLGKLLRKLFESRIDPEDVGVYIPEVAPFDEDENNQNQDTSDEEDVGE